MYARSPPTTPVSLAEAASSRRSCCSEGTSSEGKQTRSYTLTRTHDEHCRGPKMWRFEAALLCCLCVATMLLPPSTLAGSQSKYGQACSTETLDGSPCGEFERCQQESGGGAKCTCNIGFEYINERCTKTATTPAPTPPVVEERGAGEPLVDEKGGSSVAAILLVPTCLIIIGALGYFGARRYKWLQRFRQFRQNRYGSVLVTRDDTDDDDPPIA